jgi:hypothetical protein
MSPNTWSTFYKFAIVVAIAVAIMLIAIVVAVIVGGSHARRAAVLRGSALFWLLGNMIWGARLTRTRHLTRSQASRELELGRPLSRRAFLGVRALIPWTRALLTLPTRPSSADPQVATSSQARRRKVGIVTSPWLCLMFGAPILC